MIIGLLMILAGSGLHYWLARRAFYRKGPHPTYSRERLTPLLEWLGRKTSWLLIIGGSLLFIFFWLGRGPA